MYKKLTKEQYDFVKTLDFSLLGFVDIDSVVAAKFISLFPDFLSVKYTRSTLLNEDLSTKLSVYMRWFLRDVYDVDYSCLTGSFNLNEDKHLETPKKDMFTFVVRRDDFNITFSASADNYEKAKQYFIKFTKAQARNKDIDISSLVNKTRVEVFKNNTFLDFYVLNVNYKE